jgi:hypothetical protein
MTSISSTSSPWQQYSPSQLLQNQLQQDVSSGQVSSIDATALSSALDQIQTSLQSGASTSTSTSTTSSSDATSTTPPSPSDLQTKISSLIDAQVNSGTLTSSQASELKDVFSQTFGSGSTTADASGVQGHHGGHGGHHHAASATATDASTDTDSDATSTTASSSSSSSTDSTQQLIDQFLQSLQSAQSTSYSAAGTTGTSNLSSLLMNITA